MILVDIVVVVPLTFPDYKKHEIVKIVWYSINCNYII